MHPISLIRSPHSPKLTLSCLVFAALILPFLASTASAAEAEGGKWFAIEPRVWLSQVKTFEDPNGYKGAYFVPMYGPPVLG